MPWSLIVECICSRETTSVDESTSATRGVNKPIAMRRVVRHTWWNIVVFAKGNTVGQFEVIYGLEYR